MMPCEFRHGAGHGPRPKLPAMFSPRSIKHCRACGGAVRYETPADDNRDRAICTVCTHDPLREPAQRRRHAAGVGGQGAALPAQHRAAIRAVDAAGRLHGARRDHRRGRAARDHRGGRGAGRDAGPLHADQRRPRRPGAPVLPGAPARHRFRARAGDDRGGAVSRRRDPLGRDRLPDDEADPRALLRRPARRRRLRRAHPRTSA